MTGCIELQGKLLSVTRQVAFSFNTSCLQFHHRLPSVTGQIVFYYRAGWFLSFGRLQYGPEQVVVCLKAVGMIR